MAKRKSPVEDQKEYAFGEFKPPKKRKDFNSKLLKKPKIQKSK